jgi:shikimate dehydrogenase
MITGKTKIFGVIADPIDHVWSPTVFNSYFAERGIDAVLVPINLKFENLANQLKALASIPNMGGVLVTIPFKVDAAAICDEFGPDAQITGAVNVIRFEDGKMIGANFDGRGFAAGLAGEGISVEGKSVLMIGAGGAARAIAAALCDEGIGKLAMANRTTTKAEHVKSLIKKNHRDFDIEVIADNEIDQEAGGYDMIINTTSLGLNEGDALPCALDHLRDDAVIADIIMVPDVTTWLKTARKKGLKIHKGIHMFEYQRDLIADFIGVFAKEKQ